MNRSTCRSAGFTAVELIVTVAIIGLIISIAYPAYTDFAQRSRRTEATEALQNMATLEEQFYTHNKIYTNDLPTLGMRAATVTGYYMLQAAVDAASQTYTLQATAQGSQADDLDCAVIQLDSSGNKTPQDCW